MKMTHRILLASLLFFPALLRAQVEAESKQVIRTNIEVRVEGDSSAEIGAAVQAALQKALKDLPPEARLAGASASAPVIQVVGGEGMSAEDKQRLTDAVQKALTGATAESSWITLFNGTSLDGWKASENPGSFSVADGMIKVNGPRSHLFYLGADGKATFTNFEFEADVMTRTNSNSGIFIHTKWQDNGWPAQGYECQVNNSMSDPQRTGGLYNTVKINPSPAQDDVWFHYYIKVAGKHVTVKIDDKTVVDYEEPADRGGTVKLSAGTFALQAHDPKSVVFYKNIRARHLP